MPLVLADRVRDTTTTTGTGTVTLSGTAPTGYQNFSVIGNGNTTYYTINAGSQWEVGIGTYSSTGPTLSRDTVLSSSAGGTTKVDFAAGTKDVFVTYPSGEAVYQDGASIAAGTAVLPVANGGTGVTTSTGTGSVVLSNSPTLVTPVLGAASATSIANGLGTVSAPSYTFTGDLNTGIYSPAADTLAFVEGGVEAMRIDSSANVGIGISGQPNRLFVYANQSDAALAVRNDGAGAIQTWASFGTEYMRIAQGGNVGIGTASPGAKLDVNGSVRFVDSTSSGPDLEFGNIGGNTTINNVANARNYYGAFEHVFTNFNSSTERMRIDSSGNVGIGTSSPTARLNVSAGEGRVDITATNAGGRNWNLYSGGGGNVGAGAFAIAEGGATQRFVIIGGGSGESMRIDASGNVGIGTTAPNANLQISSANTTVLRLTTTGAATQSALSFVTVGGSGSCELDQTGNLVLRTLQGSVFFDNFGASGAINFRTNGANTRMTITNTGDVGIGTNSPSTKLDVVGAGIRAVTTTTTSAGSPLGSQIYLGDANFASSFALQGPGIGAVFDAVQSVAASLAFYTYSSATRNERMRILSTGEVGVNTTAPGTTFEVALSTTGLPGLRASRSAVSSQYIQMDIGGGASARLFATGGNKAMYIINNNSGAGLGTATDSTFIQVPGPTANTPITAMYLESSTANVGIGTTAPAGRVHAVNTYTNTSNTNFIADGNIPGLNLRPANGRFSLLASYGAANTSSIVLGTGTANPSTEAMRFDHSTGGINVGAATPNAAAQLQVDSTTRGFLPPRMTTAQRDAITTPPDGLVLYNTSTNKLQVRAAGAWTDLH